MKSHEYIEKVRHLKLLEDIEQIYAGYLQRIEKEKEYFTVQSIGFTARGDGERMQINSHHPIPAKYIYDGLVAARIVVNQEIQELRKEIKSVTVEL